MRQIYRGLPKCFRQALDQAVRTCTCTAYTRVQIRCEDTNSSKALLDLNGSEMHFQPKTEWQSHTITDGSLHGHTQSLDKLSQFSPSGISCAMTLYKAHMLGVLLSLRMPVKYMLEIIGDVDGDNGQVIQTHGKETSLCWMVGGRWSGFFAILFLSGGFESDLYLRFGFPIQPR
jgi:hypothetical protein